MPPYCHRLSRQGFAEAVRKYRVETKDQLSPAEQGEAFVVPRLVAEIQGESRVCGHRRVHGVPRLVAVEVFGHVWMRRRSPSGRLRAASRSTSTATVSPISSPSEAEQLALDVDVEGWTPEALVLWLDRQVASAGHSPVRTAAWLRELVGHLTGPRSMHIAALMRCKFILARKVREKLAAFASGTQQAFISDICSRRTRKVEVSFDKAFAFRGWDVLG